MNADGDLSGRVALVTGGSKGIGRAIALELAGRGADVAIAARGKESLETTAVEIRELGQRAAPIVADLTEVEAADRVVASVIADLGGLDIIVNNVAVSGRPGSLRTTELDNFEQVFRTNVWVPLRICQAGLESMKARGRGVIVNIASNEGIRPSAGMGVYPASKAALLNLTVQMAKEWATVGVRAVAIAPGLVRTELAAPLVQAVESSDLKLNPLGRVGEPEDIAKVVALFASDGASFVTATTFVIDGGELSCGPLG